jgi:hypothetical protein
VKTISDVAPKDFLMQIAWQDFLWWAIGEKEIVKQFEEQTGMKFSAPKNGIEKMIDDATGFQSTTLERFVVWATETMWDGEPESTA